MLRLAIKMLIQDRAKFLSLLLGLTFSTFIISQQAGIFTGLMQRTYGFLTDTSQPDIWVMEPQVQFIDDVKPMRSSALFQTRGIEGVKWAVPMYKGLITARLRNNQFQICNVIGLDDATLIGGPPRMTVGELTNLRFPNAVIVNEVGAKNKLATTKKGQNVPLKLGDIFELKDSRAKVMGFCKVTRTFLSQPVIYTTFSNALNYSSSGSLERNLLSFILVKANDSIPKSELCAHIKDITGLAAYTTQDFKKKTVLYYVFNTGITLNFGVAVILGIIIGSAIAGQTFYNFAYDNRYSFATLKAMGATNKLLTHMVLMQAFVLSLLSFGIGIGLTALFGFITMGSELSFTLPWWLILGTGIIITCIASTAALIGLRSIIRLEPGIVFQT